MSGYNCEVSISKSEKMVKVCFLVSKKKLGRKMQILETRCIFEQVQLTTRTTETSITNLTRITNEMATCSDYLMKYFNGFLAVLLE